MIEGERILLRKSNLSGTIAYIGPIEFASGTWIGIELDVPVGKLKDKFIAFHNIHVNANYLEEYFANNVSFNI